MNAGVESPLETKLLAPQSVVTVLDGGVIEGYASIYGRTDQGGDSVAQGAFKASLARRGAAGVRMLWQHDPREPIGVWETVEEDRRGLKVRGRLIEATARGREAAALVAAGAIDGLSIGYRTLRAEKAAGGRRLVELDLWEVSLVTFPMLPEARLGAKGLMALPGAAGRISGLIAEIRAELAE